MDNDGQISYWFDSLEESSSLVEEIPRQIEVAIVGAGFTGLWTAYYLKKKSPGISIAVFFLKALAVNEIWLVLIQVPEAVCRPFHGGFHFQYPAGRPGM